ncbi:MAG: choice-of-anchor J domain-containing protein [Bacteroidales bacterium]|nr:choice-of-anchor J domain-containing protein [Bacteroidales bacterium]
MKKLLLLFTALLLWSGSSWGQKLYESFENARPIPPEGWTAIYEDGTSAENTIDHSTFQKYVGFRSFLFTPTTQHDQYLITPQLNVTEGDQIFSFWYRSREYRHETFSVGLSVTGNTINDFTWSEDVNASSTWQRYLITQLSTETKYIAIRYKSNGRFGLFIDNVFAPSIHSDMLPNCAELSTPQNIATDVNVAASLNWDNGGGAPAGYKLNLGTDNPPTNIENATDLGTVFSYDPTGDLAYSTTYYWQVVPYNANGDATNCTVWSFTTMPDPIVSIFPYTQNFESDVFPPNGWEEVRTPEDANPGWERPYETQYARFDSYDNANGNISNLITPQIDLTALSTAQLKFNYKKPKGGDFSVLLSTDGGATYPKTILSGLTNQAEWTERTADISTFIENGNNIKIAFKGTSNYGNWGAYIYLDDITIEQIPTCPAPKVLTVANITASSANLGWTEKGEATNWKIEWNAGADFTPGTGASDGSQAVTTNPYSLTGLAENTTYYWYVKAVCGEGDESYWIGPKTFTTEFGPKTIPYIEGFENGNEYGEPIANQWVQEAIIDEPGYSDYSPWSANNIMTGEARRAPRFGSWNSILQYFNKRWMFQSFSLEGGKTYIFDMFARHDNYYQSPQPATITVKYGSSSGSGNMDKTIIDEALIYTDVYQLLTGTFKPDETGTYSIGILGTTNDDTYYICIDDIAVYESTTCLAPLALTVSDITVVSAKLDWTARGSAATWNIKYGEAGFDFETEGTTISSINTTSTELSGLESLTDYDWYIQAACGEGGSLWVGPHKFTTEKLVSPPHFEGFATESTPEGWNTTDCTIGIRNVNPAIPAIDGNYIYANLWGNVESRSFTTVNIGPVLDGMLLTFDYAHVYKSDAWEQDYGNFVVYVSTDYGKSYNVKETIDNTTITDWQFKSIDLSEYAGKNVKIKIKANRTVQNLNNGRVYYLAFDNFNILKRPVAPSNHVSGIFAAAKGRYDIKVNWNDNDGLIPASGFLIMASTIDNFTAPVDGVVQSDDTDLSDSTGQVNILSGVENYNWAGLNAGTKYYFNIFPYDGFRTLIKYKTDGIIPTANATTRKEYVAPVLASATAGVGKVDLAWSVARSDTKRNSSGYYSTSNVESNVEKSHGPTVQLPIESGGAVGDDCGNPIVIVGLPFTDENTTAGRGNTYSETCLGGYDGGEDIVYQLEITEAMTIEIDMQTTATWTGMLITTECPIGYGCVNYVTGSSGPKNMVVDLEAGTYYIMLDSWPKPNNFDFTLTVKKYVPRIFERPAGAKDEGEDCIVDGEDDVTNGGCNMVDPLFTTIEDGDVIWGSASTYILNNDNYRDTDYYELVITDPKIVTFTLTAEFPAIVGFLEQYVPGEAGCYNMTGGFNPNVSTTPYNSGTITKTLNPGTYYYFVAINDFFGYSCGTSNYYIAELTCEDAPYFNVIRNGVEIAQTPDLTYTDRDVLPGEEYCYTISETPEEGVTTAESNEICATVPFATESVWYGSSNDNWHDPTNWSNSLPGASTDVIIPLSRSFYPTISSPAQCKNITIYSGVYETASLLDNGFLTVNGSATIQRYLTGGWGDWNTGWHLISSPVAAQPISAFATEGVGNGYDFYGWDEATSMWINYKEDTPPLFNTWNGGTNFNAGQGYMISYEAAKSTQTFTGALNTENITKENLSKSTDKGGWHLLGNPFASALTWNDGTNWALSNVAGNTKIWHEANKSYKDIAANEIIPSAQGFMIQVSDASNSITIPAASRVHNAQAFYKSTNQQLLLVAAETEGGSAQESKIIINPQASKGFDFEHDSRFLAGYAPVFYSMADDEYLSTNSIPALEEDMVIPFGFVKNDASEFTITLKESIAGSTVYLADKQTGELANLSKNPVYSFTSSAGDDAERFLLSFGAVGIGQNTTNEGVNAYAYDNIIYIKTPLKTRSSVNVYSLGGQLVLQGKTNGNTLTTLNATVLKPGVYVVHILLNNSMISRKVVIN